MGVWRFAYTGGPDTPGPNPKAIVPQTGSLVQFNIGKSGGVSYTWDFGDGSPKVTTTERGRAAHLRLGRRQDRDADGELRRRRRPRARPSTVDVPTPLFTNVDEEVVGERADWCSRSRSAPRRSFGAFQPSVDRDYTASTTANGAGLQRRRALLTVSDAVTATAGQLVNADYTLPSTLQARALEREGHRRRVRTGSAARPTRRRC